MTEVAAGSHHGTISTEGLGGSSDRSLLDFFQVAFNADHLANIIYTTGGANEGGTTLAFVKQQAPVGVATTTTSAGATSAPNGGTAAYTATVRDASGAPVTGAPVTFTLGSMKPFTATTDATGTAKASQAVTL